MVKQGTKFLLIGALFGLTGVAAGAFGAHGLKGRLAPEMIAIFELAVRYQLYHALALLALGAAMDQLQHPTNMLAGWILVSGTVIFSGTLYLLSLSGVRWWGMITPIGGFALLAGWACLAWSAWSQLRARKDPK